MDLKCNYDVLHVLPHVTRNIAQSTRSSFHMAFWECLITRLLIGVYIVHMSRVYVYVCILRLGGVNLIRLAHGHV